jgi:hypothetical protein
MTIAILIIVSVIAVGLFVVECILEKVEEKLEFMRSDLDQLRSQWVPPNIGARRVPTPVELATARNRMDQAGVAHPGGPG